MGQRIDPDVSGGGADAAYGAAVAAGIGVPVLCQRKAAAEVAAGGLCLAGKTGLSRQLQGDAAGGRGSSGRSLCKKERR